MSESLYKSYGVLKYFRDPFKCIVEVDQDLADYYRKLVPKAVGLRRQGWAAHISVVRNRTPQEFDLLKWGKYEGELVGFAYSPIVESDEVYFWINCYSLRLEEVRNELGLPLYEHLNLPQGYSQRLHCTIGNIKNI